MCCSIQVRIAQARKAHVLLLGKRERDDMFGWSMCPIPNLIASL